MAKKIVDDVLKWTLEINGEPAKKELGELEQTTRKLEKTNKDLKVELQKLEANNKKNTKEYKNLQTQIKKNNQTITTNKARMGALRKEIGLSSLTMRQLRSESKRLKNQLDNTTPNTPAWNKYNKQLEVVQKRMGQVRAGTKRVNKTFGALKNLLPVIGIGAFITGIGSALKGLFGLAKTMQGESKRAAIVFGDELGFVQSEADKLAGKMGATNHQFTAMAANTADLLIPLGFLRKDSADMSVRLQSVAGALDEWTSGTVGLTEVSNILTKAMLGEMEQLKTLGVAIRQDSIEFRDLVKQKKEDTDVTDGQARALATLDLIYEKTADARTAYTTEGNKLLRTQKSISLWWRKTKENVVAYFDTKPSEKIEQERIQVNLLVIELNNVNTEEARRLEIMTELNRIAPEVVETLTEEGKATATTTEALKKYNEQLINRVILAGKQEQLQTQIEKAAKFQLKEFEAEEKLNKEIINKIESIKDEVKQRELMDIMLDRNLSTGEKVNKLEAEGIELRKQGSFWAGILGVEVSRDELTQFEIFQNISKKRKKIVADMALDIKNFKETSGLGDILKDEPPPPGGVKPGDYDKQLKNLEDFNKRKILKIKQEYANEELSASEFHSELLTQELSFLRAKLALQNKYKEDNTDVLTEITDIHIDANEALTDLYKDQMDDLLESMQDADKEHLDWLIKSGEADIAATIKTNDAIAKANEDKEKEETQDSKDAQDRRLQQNQDYADATIDIFDSVSSMFLIGKQRELKAAGENEKEKERIEERYFKRQKAIGIATAGIEGLLEIARINSNAAVNADITQTLRIILTAAAIIRTGATIAAIASQEFFEGGFTGGNNKNKPAGIVHEKEWVASEELVKDPITGKIINALELIRIGALNKKELSLPNFKVMSIIPQLQSGGFASSEASPDISQPQRDINIISDNQMKNFEFLLDANTKALNDFTDRMKKGTISRTVMTEFEEVDEEFQELKSEVTIEASES